MPQKVDSPWRSPPSAEHLEQIAAAKRAGAKIRRATVAVLISGWTLAVFAGLTFLVGLASFSPVGLALGAGMLIVTFFEFRGAGELKRLDPGAPRRLALNQLALGAMLVTYAGYSMWAAMNAPPGELEAAVASSPEMAEMAGDIVPLVKELTMIVYAVVMVVAIAVPGVTAMYYYSRKKHILAYIKQTPQWILDLQRAGMSL